MDISTIDFRNSKCICLHGIKISDTIDFSFNYHNGIKNIHFIPYSDFISKIDKSLFMNIYEIQECDIVVAIENCRHNTLEVQAIKIAFSIVYFANRMNLENNCSSRYIGFFNNYILDGYNAFIDENRYIEHASWFVKIGTSPLCNDDFDMWLPRIYGSNLDSQFDRRDGLEKCIQLNDINIKVDKGLLSNIDLIQNKINCNDQYSNKLLSVFRIYYSLLCDYADYEQNDILFCTILESLLLKKGESDQRKKAAARAACIVANNDRIEKKKFIANNVYYFYSYRNSLIHDGKTTLDFDEIEHNRVHTTIKHIIYYIIEFIVQKDIKKPNDLIDIVKQNANKDKLAQAFDYIDSDSIDNDYSKLEIIFNE